MTDKMDRYGDVTDNVIDVFMNVVEEYFSEIGQLKVKLIFDSKKRVSKGKFVLASTEVVNDKIKFLTATDLEAGYDYLVIINEIAWEQASDKDKVRLMRHELRHIYISDEDKYQILPHDVEDFMIEIKMNQDSPEWAEILCRKVISRYESMKEEK